MRTAIQMWGHSLAVRIPRAVAKEVGLDRRTVVDIAVEDGRIVVTPVPVASTTLDALLAGVTSENIHGEVATGAPFGNEVW